MNELLISIRKNAIGLGIFALVTAGIVAAAHSLTADRIAHNIRLAQAKALNEIVPIGSYDNDLLADTLSLQNFDTTLLGPIKDNVNINFARINGEITTVLIPTVAPDGYTQEIGILVGIKPDGSLAGVRVTEHRETPGLGDKVDLKKSPWILGFAGKSLTNPEETQWTVKKDGGDFDQFTGATITPRAVVKAVKRAQLFFNKHQEVLLSTEQTGLEFNQPNERPHQSVIQEQESHHE